MDYGMFSNGKIRRRATVLVALIALGLFSCGVKAPPRPPAPEPVQAQPEDSHHDDAQKGTP
jgi:hypothetical protein